RFLPVTKSVPKQMLPIVDQPILEYVAREAAQSGIKDIFIVNQSGQEAMADYFDSSFEIEAYLEMRGKTEMLSRVKAIPRMANFIFLRQTKDYPYGNATPLLLIKSLIKENEPFVYAFGDDLVKSKVPCMKQLIDVYEKHRPVVVEGVQEVPWEEISRYGSVRYKQGTKIHQIAELIEKPSVEEAPSNMAQFGRFVFTPKVIETAVSHFEAGKLGKGNELWIADIINELAQTELVIGQPIEGKWMTTGDPLSYMKTMVEYALDRKDIGPGLRDYLKNLKL
ncbi:UTP--glucose-1-phosphate uridylyltransferase, partial [Patescibacteria group bacterium]|nr:UTP--glucose-1-phosphate uridylyltransferase [Patescibacteria group bacterium]